MKPIFKNLVFQQVNDAKFKSQRPMKKRSS